MALDKSMPFKKAAGIESRIDEFLDKVSEASLVFEEGIKSYLDKNSHDDIEQRLEKIRQLEKRGDDLRKSIETELYTEMLIPESRSDVWHLLDAMDRVLDSLKRNFLEIWIQHPEIPQKFHQEFQTLVHAVVQSVEAMVAAGRAFFKDIQAVRNHIHKVGFFESESDRCAIQLKKEVFASSLHLDRKIHLGICIDKIDKIADLAEDVGDSLAIYSLKRAL